MSDQVAEVGLRYFSDDEGGVVPEGYKQTELGVIPEDWELQELSEDVRLVSGHHVMARYCNSTGAGVPYLTGPADFPNGQILISKFTERPTSMCECGDILITVKGSGAGSLVESNGAYCISRQLMSIQARDWNSIFLKFSIFQNAEAIKSAVTGLIPGLSRSDILVQKLPIPPLKEQTAIANALSDIDALISEQEKLIAKKQAIKTATMQQLLTGRTRLPQFALREDGSVKGYKQSELGEVPEDWGVKPLGELADIYSGGTPNRKNLAYWNGDIPWVTTTLVHGGEIKGALEYITRKGVEGSSTRWCEPGSILMAMYGQGKTRGKVALLGIEATINQACAAIVLKDVSEPDFIFNCLESKYEEIREQSNSGGQENLSSGIIKTLLVPLPQKKEQTAIAKILVDMNDEIETLQHHQTKNRQIKQGMMQELLTGKTRLFKPSVKESANV